MKQVIKRNGKKVKFDKEKMVMENSIKSTQVFLDVFNNTSSK